MTHNQSTSKNMAKKVEAFKITCPYCEKTISQKKAEKAFANMLSLERFFVCEGCFEVFHIQVSTKYTPQAKDYFTSRKVDAGVVMV